MHVKLTRKLANSLDGVDVSNARVGDIIDVSTEEAAALVREGWAEGVDVDSSVMQGAESASEID